MAGPGVDRLGEAGHGMVTKNASNQPLESYITRSIIRALRMVPGPVVRKRRGSTLGTSGDPDLYGSYRGRHFEIVVKRPGRKLTPLQQPRLKEWALAGAIVGVAHSAEEAMDIVVGRRK